MGKKFAFFSKENATKKPIVSFDREYHQRTSKALGVSSTYPRSMRVRVSLDFAILIGSFISLCITETVGEIFREYKPWIVILL
jgi:hypothetical protein